MFTKQIPIFQEGMSVRRIDTDFLGGYGLFAEQVPIFQEHPFSYRTDNDFQGRLFRISTNR